MDFGTDSWTEYDPYTGLYEQYEFDSNGKLTINRWQDVQPYVDRAKEMANSGICDDNWKATGTTIYATLPAIVLLQLLQKGIDFLDPNAAGRVVEEINANYPYLKTTWKHHELPRD